MTDEIDITPEGDFIPRGSPGAGKGDKKRPTQVSDEEYIVRWNQTFIRRNDGTHPE